MKRYSLQKHVHQEVNFQPIAELRLHAVETYKMLPHTDTIMDFCFGNMPCKKKDKEWVMHFKKFYNAAGGRICAMIQPNAICLEFIQPNISREIL